MKGAQTKSAAVSEKARLRMQVISKVLAGQLQATEGAQALGITRQAYYTWEERYVTAALASMEDRPPGRPSDSGADPEKEQLRRELEQRERQLALLSQSLRLKEELAMYRTGCADTTAAASETGKKKSGPRRR